jgi:hypothetical protein
MALLIAVLELSALAVLLVLGRGMGLSALGRLRGRPATGPQPSAP